MILNIASAGLLWTDYLTNSTNVKVTYIEYVLSITELVLIILWLIPINNNDRVSSVLFLIIKAFNIAYSAYAIEYYNNQEFLPMEIINIALAIIILNSITLFLSCLWCCLKSWLMSVEEISSPTSTTTTFSVTLV